MFGFPVQLSDAVMYAIQITYRAQPKQLPEIPTNPHMRGTIKHVTWSATITDEAWGKLNRLAGVFQYEVGQMAAACLIGVALSIKQVKMISRHIAPQESPDIGA